MKKIKILSCASILVSALLTGCGESKDPVKPNPNPGEQKEEKSDAPLVFVFSGQSNMEGQTNVGTDGAYLKAAFESLGITDGDDCFTGINSVLTSYYGNGYGQLDHTNYNRSDVHASNKEDKIKGQFLPTKIGMGHSDTQMGPELGCAYALKEYATEERPIYFVKMASSGSGFEQSNTQYNWLIKNEETGERMPNNLYDAFLKPFLQNNLDWIEETTGEKPIIKAWCWHQGESDSEDKKRAKYCDRLDMMINEFRTDFASYADDEDGEKIAFIDGLPFEGGTTLANAANAKDLNAKRIAAAETAVNRYIVDPWGNREHTDENILKVSGDGATSGFHYNTKDDFTLGMAYGKVILDNILNAD